MQENCLFYENGRNVPELGWTSRLKENVAVTHHFFEKELVVKKKYVVLQRGLKE